MRNSVVCGKYRLGEELRAGLGWVEYKGEDESGQSVWVRFFDSTAAGINGLDRLEAARDKLGGVPEQFLCEWLAVCEHEDSALVISRPAAGSTLADRIAEKGPLSFDDTMDLAHGLASYLHALHSAGIMQGFFDAADLFFDGENPPVAGNPAAAAYLDVSAICSGTSDEDQAGTAPELFDGHAADPCSDVYALGAVLFEALTGQKVPKPDLSPGKTRIVTWLPGRLRNDIPEALDQLVGGCLHPERQNRIADPGAVLAYLEKMRAWKTEAAEAKPMGMEDALVGQTLGPYRLVDRLGQGGMASVYKGYEPALDRYVAIKVLPQYFAQDPNFTARFQREAKAVAQLTHPNIVPIYNFGEDSGIKYIAMQLVEGGSLKYERGDRMDYREALQLLLPIGRALGYAHERGIIHRDIKPSNVLISGDGWPMLADFGLAKMVEGSAEKLTGTGVGMGTPMYMSPEQGQGVGVDHRSDLYSLGIMLYELVTGDVPFRADTPMAIVIKHMTAPMPMPRSLNPDLPEAVESIILKATAKDKEDRFETAEAMIEAMERVLAGSPLPDDVRTQRVPREEETPEIQAAAAPRKRLHRETGPMQKLLYGVLGVVGAVVLGVVLMGVFDICPPEGPWPQPPWCEGSPFQFTSGGSVSDEEIDEIPQPVLTSGTFGMILFEDSFEDQVSRKWQFTCSPTTTPWILDEVDGRTVFRSQPSTNANDESCAEVRGTTWVDYAQEFDFKFDKPDRFGVYYFRAQARILDCPPNVSSIHAYSVYVFSDGIELMKAQCTPPYGDQPIASSGREISVDEWHTMHIIVVGNRIQVLVDGEVYLDYVDEDEPLLDGGDLWFDIRDQNEILLDNMTIYEIIPSEGEDIVLPE